MGQRTLIYYGNPILRQKAKPVGKITDEIHDIISDMKRVMKEHNAAGLCAPQVAESLRMFLVSVDSRESDGVGFMTPPKVFINPKIEIIGDETETTPEGCISIPHVHEDVTRPFRIKVTATGIDGKIFTEESFGYRARCALHENDHLNGVLSIDRTSSKRRKQIAPLLKKIKKKYSRN